MGNFKKNGFDRNRSRSDERRNRGEFGGRKPRDFNENRPSRFRPDSDGPRSFDRDEPRSFENGPRPFVRTSKGPLELFDATCDKCGIQCELPFKPRGGKPVYCRDCFRKNNGSESEDGPSHPSVPTISTEQFITLNRKLDKIMRALKLD